MSAFKMLVFVALVGSTALADDLVDLSWREEFRDAKRWTPQPAWLSNLSPTAAVTTDGQAACFRVDEPHKGMKWSASMPRPSLAEQPYLIVRYRAENLDTRSPDYFIYLDDRVAGKQLNAIRLCDVAADGKWHVAAVDLTTLTAADAVYSMAVQVQAGEKGKARAWLDWLTFAAEAPKGAEVIQRVPRAKPKPDWAAPLAKAKWVHRNDWLSNPAQKGTHSVERKGEATVFRVAAAGRGMKWSWALPEPAALEGRRYVSMRYRATALRPVGDYALCVIGKPRGDGLDYTAVIASGEIISDGRWHTVNADIRTAAARFPKVGALAVQVQAASADAKLEVADIRFTNTVRPTGLADALDWRPGAKFAGFHPISIEPAARSRSTAWRRHLRLADWFTQPAVTVSGLPFRRPPGEADLAATSIRAKSELRFAADVAASEVYVLLLAAFIGPEEPPYGGGKFRVIRDVDRFRLRLEYADGTADECLPMNVATKQFGLVPGAQVVVAAADDARKLRAVVLRDLARQAAFAVAAVTARTHRPRAFPEALEETPPLKHHPRPAGESPSTARLVQDRRYVITTASAEIGIRMDGLPILDKLMHRPTGWNCLARPCPLIELRVDGQAVSPERVRRTSIKPLGRGEEPKGHEGVLATYEIDGGIEVRFAVAQPANAPPREQHGFVVHLVLVRNTDRERHRIALVAPRIGPYRLADAPQDSWYLVPRRGAAFDNRSCSYAERYCGLFPVQFLDTFSPGQGRGLRLLVCDTFCRRKQFMLRKEGNELFAGVEYPEQVLEPGATFDLPVFEIKLTDGHWRRGLDAYRAWVASWHKPAAPRKKWFREIFNFRQRFLWHLDPLGDAKTGELHLQRAVDEARKEFGGVEYLHLFDWGNVFGVGRIYGRTGDHSPYKHFQGGREGFRKAIAGVKARGVPVGLYIEGYLLQEKGKLGQKHGRDWQLVGRDGKGKYWPSSTEMFVCPGVAAWRKVQASTYAAKVKELDVDGMYIDQFGFAGGGKDCWSKSHGHGVPSYAVATERDCTQIIRRAIDAAKKGVAIYTEESPVDVTSAYQDGSFTYAMFAAQRLQTRVPLNLFRFAFPSFKTIEILYCDKPTGSWATGVKWVFFNGEAIWLEGPAAEWFEPETREVIRRYYRILRKHRDAFTTDTPVPLVATQAGGVFANAFPIQGKTVYTLYNSRHRTFRGAVLRIRRREGITYHDEWHRRPATVRRDGADDVIHAEIGPHGVGCIVARPAR